MDAALAKISSLEASLQEQADQLAKATKNFNGELPAVSALLTVASWPAFADQISRADGPITWQCN